MKFLGHHFDLMTIIISLIIGGLASCHLFCGCLSLKKEGFSLMGAPLDYKLGANVPGDSWATGPPISAESAVASMYAPLAGNVGGKVPLPDDQMFFFYNNKFSPECCFKPQQYSSSTGCACISVDQMKHLSARGGNNTLP
jgi:hypothetical protein